jgi:hypothetical protein
MNGCIGVANYRFYIQFLCYVSLLATWIFVTSLIAFIQYHGLVNMNMLHTIHLLKIYSLHLII